MNPIPDNWRDLPALSIRQPWAWFIVNAGKDVENRTWRTNYRGPVLIHAAKGCTRAEFADALEFAGKTDAADILRVPDLKALERGGIVAVAELVECVEESDSPWFVGPVGFVLRDVRALPFTTCAGSLGFFKPSFTPAEPALPLS